MKTIGNGLAGPFGPTPPISGARGIVNYIHALSRKTYQEEPAPCPLAGHISEKSPNISQSFEAEDALTRTACFRNKCCRSPVCQSSSNSFE